jgi:hypothetical protein
MAARKRSLKATLKRAVKAATSLIPSNYIPAKIRRDPKTGEIKALVDPSKLKFPKRKNVAAGFYDEFGQFHPLRQSFDYVPSRVGETKRYVKGGAADKEAKAARRSGLKAARKKTTRKRRR